MDFKSERFDVEFWGCSGVAAADWGRETAKFHSLKTLTITPCRSRLCEDRLAKVLILIDRGRGGYIIEVVNIRDIGPRIPKMNQPLERSNRRNQKAR
jgi:hypothetical protein